MILGTQNSILTVLIISLSFLAKGQISGYVYDSSTKEPLKSCNIFDPLMKIGTITNQQGEFKIQSTIGSKLSISFVGYKSKNYLIKKNKIDSIYLEPLSKKIEEVLVIMKPDPAIAIIEKAIKKNKSTDKKNTISNRTELLKIYLINQKSKINPLNKSILFQQYSDSLKKGVPSYLSIHKYKNDSLIEESSSGISIRKDYFKDYINSINIDFDIQENNITLFGRSIISPISKYALDYYNYYLHDSILINNEYCYKIKIVSKNKSTPTFSGIIWINTSSFEIQKAELYLRSNFINFIKHLTLLQEFNNKNAERYQKRNYIELSLSLSDLYFADSLSILVERSVSWGKNKKPASNTYSSDSLFQKEIEIIKSLNNDGHIKLITKLSETLISSYFSMGIINIGPIYQMHSNNKIEGQRISFIAKTNEKFQKNCLISAYIGRGLNDNRNKYGFAIKIRNKKENSLELGISMRSDIEYLGSSFINNSLYPNNFNNSSENILSYLFKKSEDNEMAYFNKKQISLTKEFERCNLSLFYNQKSIERNSLLLMKNDLFHSNLGFRMRYSQNKKVKNHFDIINVKSKFPVFFIGLDITKNFLSDKISYSAKFATLHTINTSVFGRTKYLLDIGVVKGNDDYSLYNLELHRANQSYIYDFTKSSLMNKYEFISDRYAALYIEQHLNGRILNNFPVIKKLELREVFISNIVLGNVHNRANIDNLPSFTTPLNYYNPYIEIGVGLENIFKILRINTIWRLSHLENKNVAPFGVFGGISLSL